MVNKTLFNWSKIVFTIKILLVIVLKTLTQLYRDTTRGGTDKSVN